MCVCQWVFMGGGGLLTLPVFSFLGEGRRGREENLFLTPRKQNVKKFMLVSRYRKMRQ